MSRLGLKCRTQIVEWHKTFICNVWESPVHVQVRRLEAEVSRLRCELAYARAQSSSAQSQAGPGGNDSSGIGCGSRSPDPGRQDAAAEQEQAALAPRVAVPQLDFAVDQLVCVGACTQWALPSCGMPVTWLVHVPA